MNNAKVIALFVLVIAARHVAVAQQAAYPVGTPPPGEAGSYGSASLAAVQLAAVDLSHVPSATTLGLVAEVRSWIWSSLAVDVAGWVSTTTAHDRIWGALLGAAVALGSDTASPRFLLVPRAGFSGMDGRVVGYGLDVSVQAQLHPIGPVSPALAVGGLLAFSTLEPAPVPALPDSAAANRARVGFGPYACVGGSMHAWGPLRIYADVSGHLQVSDWIMSTQVVLAFRAGVALDM